MDDDALDELANDAAGFRTDILVIEREVQGVDGSWNIASSVPPDRQGSGQ
jgi:hypothetical protein